MRRLLSLMFLAMMLASAQSYHAVAAAPIPINSLLRQAQVAFDRHQYAAANILFTRITQVAPTSAPAWAGKARTEAYLNEPATAVADYAVAIKLAPKSALYRERQGLSYYDLGLYTQALADYNTALALDPHLADAYFNRAAVEDARGQYLASVTDNGTGLRFDPTWWQAYKNRADSELSLDRWDAAIADLTVYITHTARGVCACAYYERGNANFELGRYEEAYANQQQAILIGPAEPDYYGGAGAAAVQTHRYAEAIRLLTIAIAAVPDDDFTRYYRGLAYLSFDQFPAARADLRIALQLAETKGDTTTAGATRDALARANAVPTPGASATSTPRTAPPATPTPTPTLAPSA